MLLRFKKKAIQRGMLYLFSGCLVLAPHAGFSEEHSHPQNSQTMSHYYGHGTPPISPLRDMENREFRIGPLKQHWTLLYFWADWCVPCVREGIPALTSFVNSHQQEKDSFRIVAIRFNSIHEAGDWNDFHVATKKLEKTVWHSVPPFPLVYDNTMHMTTDWGIHELPTYALIDPDGNLVRGGNLEMLRDVVEDKHAVH